MNAQRQQTAKVTVTPVPSGLLQRACACSSRAIVGGECAECAKKKGLLQRKANGDFEGTEVPPIVHEVLRSPGQPLDPATRAFFEPRFGHDFSQVRVHTDARAAESARAVNALAYTVGRDVVFGTEQYSPGTVGGRKVLAHELAHTIQQSTNNQQEFGKLETISPLDPTEQVAENAADTIVLGHFFSSIPTGSVGIARQKKRTATQRSTSTGGGSPPLPQMIGNSIVNFHPLPFPVIQPGLCLPIDQGGFMFEANYDILFPQGTQHDVWNTGFVQNMLSDEMEVKYAGVPPKNYKISGTWIDIQSGYLWAPFVEGFVPGHLNPDATLVSGQTSKQASFNPAFVDALGLQHGIQSSFNANPQQRVQSFRRKVVLRDFLASGVAASSQIVVHAVSQDFSIETTVTFGLVSQFGVNTLQANPPQTVISPNPPNFVIGSSKTPQTAGVTANMASTTAFLTLKGVHC